MTDALAARRRAASNLVADLQAARVRPIKRNVEIADRYEAERVREAPSLSQSMAWRANARAAEKRAAVERSQAVLAELITTREALETPKGRERLMLRVTVATGVFGGVSAIAAVVAIFA